MDIEISNLFPAMIVVSIERENEFERGRENESSGNARERTRQVEEKNDANKLYQYRRGTLEAIMLRRVT